MILTAHQPNYIPWLGYFHRTALVDKFIILDHIQFTKNFFIQRNKIKTPNGELMLSVPVKVNLNTLIKDVLIDNSQKWQHRHWLSIKYNYIKTPYWDYLSDELANIYTRKWHKLIDLNLELIRLINQKLGIHKELILASSLNQDFGQKTDLLVNLCKYFQADIFYPGTGCKTYIEKEKFEENDIRLVFQQFNHPFYPQLYKGFKSHLSILDLLFNCGPNALEVIMGDNIDGRIYE